MPTWRKITDLPSPLIFLRHSNFELTTQTFSALMAREDGNLYFLVAPVEVNENATKDVVNMKKIETAPRVRVVGPWPKISSPH